VDIPQKRLIIYYTENPYFLHHHYKIYKPLEDVIIEIARRALKDPLKELLGGRSHKRKENYTVNRAPKKYKA
jgi:hypothetical protein